MNETKTLVVESGKIVVSIIVALLAVQLVIGCEEPAGPKCAEECGSCNTQWDTKAQVCRDLARGVVVPESCCGF